MTIKMGQVLTRYPVPADVRILRLLLVSVRLTIAANPVANLLGPVDL